MWPGMSKTQKEEHFSVEGLFKGSYEHLRTGNFTEAHDLLIQARSMDYENTKVTASIKYSRYWLERKAIYDTIEDAFEHAEYLLREWKRFSTRFTSMISGECEEAYSSIKYFVFDSAKRLFLVVHNSQKDEDAQILLRLGRCYKGLGLYDIALEQLEKAINLDASNAEIMAEVGDAYDQTNDTRFAKICFREAFMLDPEAVNLGFIESSMIQRLAVEVKKKGHGDEVIKQWLPVYGVLYGVLNVKRELKPLEVNRLRQKIFSLRSRLQENSRGHEKYVPMLIYCYFWLIDFFINRKEEKSRIDEILLQIKALDPDIFKQYIK